MGQQNFRQDIPRELANQAFQGVSFRPEARGEAFVNEYASNLETAYERLKQQAQKGGTLDMLDEQFARYREGYKKRYRAYLASQSRCISSFITGPSNFPTRMAEKRNNVAQKRLNELFEFKSYAMKAAIRNLRPDLRPIMAGDDNAVERLQVEIEQLERAQERMKAANAAIRKNAKAGEEAQINALLAQGFTEKQARELLAPDFCGRIGFPDYALTNNNANLRRQKARLEQIARAKATPVTEQTTDDGVRIEDDPPANRVRLFFPGKPSAEIRSTLKSRGFRWAPTIGAWQAYRNYSALSYVEGLKAETKAAA